MSISTMIKEKNNKKWQNDNQPIQIWGFTLHMAIRSSSVPFISSSAEFTFLSLGEISFQMGISQNGIGETLLSSASRRTVYTAYFIHIYALAHPKAPS